jgi:hypothetical protein
MRSKRLVTTAVICVTLLGAPVGFFWYTTCQSMGGLHRREHVLLYRTGHQPILDACRLMWNDGSKYGHDEGGLIEVDPKNPNLPQAIQLLQAHFITIFPSGVNVELGGQGEHYGFESFFGDPSTDSKRTVWKGVFPSVQLTPELYFYAENGIVGK